MSKVLSFIYRQGLDTNVERGFWRKLKAKFFRSLRQSILRAGDPACQMEVWGRAMWMPFSHELPGCLARQWHYDQVLRRAADHIRSTRGPVCGIDVGANIGDTIAAARKDAKDRFLGIEPNPIFFRCLTRNLGSEPNVQLLNSVCSARDEVAEYRVTTARGTSSFEPASSGSAPFQTRTLDTIVEQNQNFSGCNFLKIDTDGHDFEVLRGARKTIARTRPTVLFECEPRGSATYIEEVCDTLAFFGGLGYGLAIVYDNDGELFGVVDLKAPAAFAQNLFYQLTSHKCNFDVLLLTDAPAFLRQELDFFVNGLDNPGSRAVARIAANLILAQ
jgi:FkbM family methyltransferase